MINTYYDYDGPPAVITQQHRLLSVVAQHIDVLDDSDKPLVRKICYKLCTLHGLTQEEAQDLRCIALSYPTIEKEVTRAA